MKLRNFKNWLINFFKLIGEIFRPVYLFLPGIFFLIVYYFIIVAMPIGQDMVMQAAEYIGPFVFTNISLLFWMMFAWFSSRLVADVFKSPNKITKEITKHFPRILGYNVAVGLQLAALNLPTINFPGKGDTLLWGLFIFHNMFYFLLYYTFTYKQKKHTILSAFFSILYIAFLIYAFIFGTSDDVEFLLFDDYKQHAWIWIFMSLIYFILQIVFVKLVLWRRNQLEQNKFNNSKWKDSYNILALIAFIIYLFIIFSPTFADLYGSLGCLLLAMGLWVGAVCYIKHKAILYNIRLTLPILIIAIIVGYFTDPYDVDLETAQTTNLYNKRSPIDTYLDHWLNDPIRHDSIVKSTIEHPYPVYLVIADGGASKSGYWVASVLSKLESKDRKDKFSTHLLSLAGASGGAVGNLAFYSLLVHQNKDNKNEYFKKDSLSQASRFMESDFLTYTLARFLGPDIVRHLVPMPMDDRAAALEDAMENASYSPLISSYFKGTLDTVFEYKGRLPMIFINTTNLETGTPGIISNIKIDTSFTNRMDILKQVDACNDGKKQKNIKLSTAVILGARFPYVSPAGEINNKYFVDGGYFDNSGGGITLELLQHIETRLKKDSSIVNKILRANNKSLTAKHKHLTANYKLLKKLKFKVIYISNGLPSVDEETVLHPLVNDLAAPLLTVLGTYGKQTNMSNEKLENYIRNSPLKLSKYNANPYHPLNLPMNPKDKIEYPMNWVISDYNLKRILEKNLNEVNPDSILYKNNHKLKHVKQPLKSK